MTVATATMNATDEDDATGEGDVGDTEQGQQEAPLDEEQKDAAQTAESSEPEGISPDRSISYL